MIFHKNKAIFFHVPKVAGVAIEQYFMPGNRDYKVFDSEIVFGLKNGIMTQHVTYSGMKNYAESEILENYFKFAFFRNPWDRFCSAFFYLEPHYLKQYGSFENCVKSVCDKVISEEYTDGWHFSKQTDYLFKDKNTKELALNFIGKYESLDKDFEKVCNLLKVPYTPLKKLNVSKKKTKNYREYYTPELQDCVARAYKEEIEYFNYNF